MFCVLKGGKGHIQQAGESGDSITSGHRCISGFLQKERQKSGTGDVKSRILKYFQGSEKENLAGAQGTTYYIPRKSVR